MKKYKIFPSNKFKKDYKLAEKRGYDLNLLERVVTTISEGKILDKKYKDHTLSGKYEGCRECHIAPDWLLIYELREEELILYLMRIGTHSDFFV